MSANPSFSHLMREIEVRFTVPCAIPVSRAALGLLAVLKCWRQRRGGVSIVAIPGAVCQEVLQAVIASGCKPVFCDVGLDDGLVSEAEWMRARALGADAAIVVHLYGNPARVNVVRSIFPAPDCLVVDDAAQSLGSCNEDGLTGGLGDVGLVSFGHTKQIDIGNAALLFHDPHFATEVNAVLDTLLPVDEGTRTALASLFRTRFDQARTSLCADGGAAASEFSGLLDGMEALLFTPFSEGIEQRLLQAFGEYGETAKARIDKARLWSARLEGTGFKPVGMGTGCVPWRYACRLPGIDWSIQHRLAEAMRAKGMHVSTWYLPAHWYLGQGAGALPGVETLSREVFQFWVDDAVTPEVIDGHAAVVHKLISSFCDFDMGRLANATQNCRT